MVHWLKVKETRNKPDFAEVVEKLKAKKKFEAANPDEAKKARKKEFRERKERNRKLKEAREDEINAQIPSYISKEQFTYLYESILDINLAVKQQAETTDEIE